MIKYTCMLPTRTGLIAKINGSWYSVRQDDAGVISIRYPLSQLEIEEFDLV